MLNKSSNTAGIIVKTILNSKSIMQYTAVPLLVPLIESNALYMECPITDENILGHSLTDDLGTTVMINSNIQDPNRKFFTQAHESGHLILHADSLKSNYIDSTQTLTKPKNEIEKEANNFAANLLLPYTVLELQLMFGVSAWSVKKICHVSIETIRWRITDYFKDFYNFPNEYITPLVDEYLKAFHHKEAINTGIFKIINRVGLRLHKIEPETFSFVDRLEQNEDFISDIIGSVMYSTVK